MDMLSFRCLSQVFSIRVACFQHGFIHCSVHACLAREWAVGIWVECKCLIKFKICSLVSTSSITAGGFCSVIISTTSVTYYYYYYHYYYYYYYYYNYYEKAICTTTTTTATATTTTTPVTTTNTTILSSQQLLECTINMSNVY